MLSLNKKPGACSALLASLILSYPVYAAKKDISFNVDGQKVIGTLETPENISKPPVVLMLHGFMGNRHELPVKDTEEGVYSRAARIMAEHGLASLRIDFRGSGDSDAKWEDTTFSSQIEDANAAVNWIKSNNKVDNSKIGILGWSQGGLIASHVAKSNPNIRSVALWAPVTHPFMTFSNLLGADLILEAAASDPEKRFSATTPWGKNTTLKAKFFKEILTKNPIGAIADYQGPLLVIRGSQDNLVINTDAWMTYHDGVEKLIEFDTDHVWSAFSGPEILDGKMLPETIDWFSKM
ncbi:alpha/beta fold hydrolase [uncultured Photobacterium sp.]|uniref:alpha/beta hydrolase n=1 Tax=uncultured Photobacterium sp. TaxID=173973 RepID=UPI00263067F1|nr:alpha/beta fold hydrolase [uncultured Photobacterium sp.]